MAVSHKEVSRKYGLTPSEREMKKTLCRWLDIYIEFFFYTSYGFSAFVECVAAPQGAFPGEWRLPPTSVFADLPEELNL